MSATDSAHILRRDGLSDVLDRYSRERFIEIRLAQTCAVAQAAGRLSDIEGRTDRPKPDELIDICRRIDAALANGEELSRRDLRRAPWCIWAPDMPLAEIPGRLLALLDRLAKAGRARLWRTLVLAWGHAFSPERAGVAAVGDFLVQRAGELGPQWAAALEKWPLLFVRRGPQALAEAAVAASVRPEALLEEVGLRDFARCEGFIRAVYQHGFAQLERDAGADATRRLATLREWMSEATPIAMREAFAPLAVSAAIAPFGDAKPDKTTQVEFTNFALSLLGDPRSQAARWTRCARAHEIMRRWLTEISLRQFFEVVDKIAKVEHWSYRQAFWRALHRRDLIDEAWVVFEHIGEQEARRMFGKDIAFGRTKGAGAQRGQTILLLRIGRLTIAEFSHNGRCSIWDQSAGESGPRLYGLTYAVADLKKPYSGPATSENLARQGVFWHIGSDTYAWQSRIAAYLKHRLNITLHQHEYRA